MNVFSLVKGFAFHKSREIFTGRKPVPLPENTPAPEFEVQDQSGYHRRLKDYRGKWVVLWFFLRASTPG